VGDSTFSWDAATSKSARGAVCRLFAVASSRSIETNRQGMPLPDPDWTAFLIRLKKEVELHFSI